MYNDIGNFIIDLHCSRSNTMVLLLSLAQYEAVDVTIRSFALSSVACKLNICLRIIEKLLLMSFFGRRQSVKGKIPRGDNWFVSRDF